MASVAYSSPGPLLLASPSLATVAGMVGAAILITSTISGTYAGAWIIGTPAILWILLAGTLLERFVLLLLLSLAAVAGGAMWDFGLRQTVFIAMFMLFARYLIVPIIPTIVMFALGLVIHIAIQGVLSELFLLGPTFLLLLKAIEVQSREKSPDRKLSAKENVSVSLMAAVALVIPLQGYGSRTALFVWGAYLLRQITLLLFILGIVGAVIIVQIPGLPIVEKLQDSIGELTQPVPDSGVGFSMRALEGLVFLGWVDTASAGELLFGSNEMIYLPGAVLGKDVDPPFVPHNYLAASLFQFGIVGFLALAAYMASLWRHMSGFIPGRYLFFMLMIPGLITSGGFITTDYAVFAAAINGLIHRYGEGSAR